MKRLLMLCVVFGVVGTSSQASPQQTARYRSEAVLWLVPAQLPDVLQRTTLPIDIRIRESLMRVLSERWVEQVMTDEKLFVTERATMPMTEVTELMRKDLDIHAGENAIIVAVVGSEPQSVQRIAKLLMDRFLSDWHQSQARLNEQAVAFVDAQLKDLALKIGERPAPTSHLATLEAEAHDAAYRDLIAKRLELYWRGNPRYEMGEQLMIWTMPSAPVRMN